MKRLFILTILIITLFSVNSCYNYGSGSQYGKLEGIAFYNLNNEEIIGEYVDYYKINEHFKNKDSLANSPAPILNYYCAKINSGDDVIVRFKIKLNNGYEFSRLEINESQLDENHFVSKQEEGSYVYLDYKYNNIDSTTNLYSIRSLYLQKNVDDYLKIVRGSTFVEGRTYISGFYFRIMDEIIYT